jgi:hypothetical protein
MVTTYIDRNGQLWPAQTSGNPPDLQRPRQQPERSASQHPSLSPRHHAGFPPFSPPAQVLLPSLRTGKLFAGYRYKLMAKHSQKKNNQAHFLFVYLIYLKLNANMQTQ